MPSVSVVVTPEIDISPIEQGVLDAAREAVERLTKRHGTFRALVHRQPSDHADAFVLVCPPSLKDNGMAFVVQSRPTLILSVLQDEDLQTSVAVSSSTRRLDPHDLPQAARYGIDGWELTALLERVVGEFFDWYLREVEPSVDRVAQHESQMFEKFIDLLVKSREELEQMRGAVREREVEIETLKEQIAALEKLLAAEKPTRRPRVIVAAAAIALAIVPAILQVEYDHARYPEELVEHCEAVTNYFGPVIQSGGH